MSYIYTIDEKRERELEQRRRVMRHIRNSRASSGYKPTESFPWKRVLLITAALALFLLLMKATGLPAHPNAAETHQGAANGQ